MNEKNMFGMPDDLYSCTDGCAEMSASDIRYESAQGETMNEINLGLRMIEPKGGFCFGTDALLLAAFVRMKKNQRGADFGSGSGAVSLLCAAAGKFAHITAFEVQSEYAELCARNVHLNMLDEKITVRNEDIRTLAAGREKFGAVFANPPYMRADTGKSGINEGRNAARHELCGGIEDFCSAAAASLEWGGAFYAVYRPDRLADLITAMRNSGIEPKRMCTVQSDALHSPSLVLAEGIRGGGVSMKIMPALMLTDGHGTMTDRARKIYETMEFNE